jgi:hypothetical protein
MIEEVYVREVAVFLEVVIGIAISARAIGQCNTARERPRSSWHLKVVKNLLACFDSLLCLSLLRECPLDNV